MRSVSTSSGASPALAARASQVSGSRSRARPGCAGAPQTSRRCGFRLDGRPQLAGGPFFSISHGLTHVAAAVCESLEIGFDLEEADAGPGSSHGVREKLQRWTATEAALKAAGRGLREARAVELDALLATATLAGARYWLSPVAIATGVVAHLAAPVAVESVEVVELDLPATT